MADETDTQATATYKLASGKTMTVEYDTETACRICGEPVGAASMGGTDVCPWCDCGHNRDGTRWTYERYVELFGKPGIGK